MSLLNQNKVQNKIGTRTVKESTDFSKIGGLSNHLKTLRDIFIVPLLHGNVFEYFNIRAPRGVLFYGPPGTGKTLVAGALATELNREGVGKVNFFQRKGADVLDKWVGESEKKLRELFEKASKCRPSIIFFDEIDGLAPTRSQKNDHIHSSIVATLLALMDGLDNKPGVIVIGATNRIETIDPALRRPGRFDRELYFPLPTLEARKEIIQVHTLSWKCKPNIQFLTHIAEATSGFNGSDLAALCSEAVLCCMKRVYPNIENLGNKVKIELDSLKVEECDFMDARQSLLPCSIKMGSKMRCLNSVIRPLLQRQLDNIIGRVKFLWPHFLDEHYKYVIGEYRYAGRILLYGTNNEGLSTHLIPALLHHFEHLPVHILDLQSFGDKDLALQNNFPSLLVLSRVDEWWSFLEESDQISFIASMEDLHAGLPILTIATFKSKIPPKLHEVFHNSSNIGLKIEHPNFVEKEKFFTPLFFDSNIVSLSTVLDRHYMMEPKPIKRLSFDMNSRLSRKSSRNKTRQIQPNVVAGDFLLKIYNTLSNCLNFKGKRKREFSDNEAMVSKRIKLCENMFAGIKPNAQYFRSSLEHEIKKEQIEHCSSSTINQNRKNKEQFTILLNELLYHRSKEPLQPSEISVVPVSSLESIACVPIKAEPNIREEYEPNDENMKKVYSLWKRASRVTSMNMTVSELELLYDVLLACINMYKYSFSILILKVEDILYKVENR
ncbi:unnamed protein product [Brassicogethes aeneus]|uniref:AAA+ ATPase domain-containing protein n=1 Tax=Brassicogethes aeneus TaxID=1431903 RepID=A0A9P0AW73_BRAAE|nr:unnamed protein product [Brassicogethes aeneus]